MKTDKQLFKIFTNMPEFFFDLTGIDYQANYTFKSETIKEISRSMDGLIEPDDLTKPHYIVEFQMQKKDDIYGRIIMEMASLGLKNKGLLYHGVIVFADKSVNVKSEPWSSLFESNNPAFQIFYLDKLLNALEEKNPEHPLVFVFQPYLRQDIIELERVASKYYSKIQGCGLPENIINSLCDVFVSWMMICFEKLSYKEVLKMMSLTTPLEDTVAYKELVAIGEKIGERKGEKIGEKIGESKGEKTGERKGIRESIINVLEVRFGNISPEVIDRVNQFDDLQELKELHRRAILLKEMDDTVFSFS